MLGDLSLETSFVSAFNNPPNHIYDAEMVGAVEANLKGGDLWYHRQDQDQAGGAVVRQGCWLLQQVLMKISCSFSWTIFLIMWLMKDKILLLLAATSFDEVFM